MNAELLAMLGSVPGVSVRGMNAEPKTLLSFKAGKMIAELQPNGKYMVTADPRRGTLEVSWTPGSSSGNGGGSSNNASGGGGSGSGGSSSSNGMLKLEWKDRRTRAVVDSIKVFPEDECTYSKVITGTGPEREGDRVYLLQFGNQSERRFFFWMQDKLEGNLDEENCVKINTFMADADAAAAAANGEDNESGDSKKDSTSKKGSGGGADATQGGAGGTLDNDALMSIMQGLNTNNSDENNSGSGEAPQVDALSNILENLGMPQPRATGDAAAAATTEDNATTESATAAPAAADPTSTPAPTSINTATPSAPAPKASSTGGLTLSDLQGAMAGLATTSPPSGVPLSFAQPQPGPPLSAVVTPENVIESGILNDENIKAKLIEMLPENQRTEDRLIENLRSPQVQQCLKSLTAALCDGEGSMDSFNSILANFQLRPEDGAIAMASGNPVQAFLDCVLKSVQREKDEKVAKEDGDTDMNE